MTKFLVSLLILAGLSVISAQRPECDATVKVKTNKLTTLNFDNIPLIPCNASAAINPVSGLLLRQLDEVTPSALANTSSTSTCHTHSGGQGIFELAPSMPNAVSMPGGAGLVLLPANKKSLTLVSLELKINLIRIVDPVVIVRAYGYDACGNEVTKVVKSFTDMQYNDKPTLFSVKDAAEPFKDLAKVKIDAYTVRFFTDGPPTISNATALVGDNLKYYVDRN
ncbi:hypothetical protein HK098_002607 [Nowakowskiella sp. JEL0407]|nr:hypothetical protein HK098_002607 [Nowakowskiella sp. JEL0407]